MEPVSALRARTMETTFLDRFDRAFQAMEGIPSPLDGKVAPRGDCYISHSEDSSLLLSSGAPLVVRYGEQPKGGPANAASLYHVSLKRSTGGPFAIGALCFSHLAAYAEHGADRVPASLADLTGILERAIQLGKTRRAVYVLGIASPVGWDAAAQELIAGTQSTKGFNHSYAGACLVDLSRNVHTVNQADKRVTQLLHLFVGELQEETALKVAAYARDALLVHDTVSATDVARATGASQDVVQRAFKRLAGESDGRLRVQDIKGIGPVLMRRS